jgi:uncharacterized membrane protein YedE/YeeE
LFAGGLAVSGMTLPAKVSGFLDVSGAWDPSLALVMGGALAVLLVVMRAAPTRPLLATAYETPLRTRIDPRLLIGATLFGVGWGLSGFCPGPALVSLGALTGGALVFVPAMLLGMGAHRLVDHLGRSGTRATGDASPPPTCG